MKKIKKKKVIIPIVIIVVIIALFNIFGQKKEDPYVSVDTVASGNIESLVEVKGKIVANDSAEITSKVNFEVVQINVKEGDKVEKGQVLALLDSKAVQDEINVLKKEIEFDELRLKESYDDLKYIYTSNEQMSLSVENAKYAEKNARLALDKAMQDEAKQRELYNEGVISKNELDLAVNTLEQAKIAYDQAIVAHHQAKESEKKADNDIKATVNQATPKESTKEAINIKRLTLQQKQDRLEDLKIKAPISGTVTRVYAKIGRNAQATENNKPMFIIEDNSKKYLVAKVGEYDISNIALGQEVSISSEVLGKDTVKGMVERISPTGEESLTSNSIVVPVNILITQNDPRLINGVSANAKIKTKSISNVKKVPFDTLYSQDGKNYVFVLQENNTIKKVEVTTGVDADIYVQIISDEIKDGMKVIKNPTIDTKDGMAVSIKENDDKEEK